MHTIISAEQLLGVRPEAQQPSAGNLIERLNARLLHARSEGASCIVLKAEDGFVLFHADRTKKPLPKHVVDALRVLDEAGYVFVKDISPDSAVKPALRRAPSSPEEPASGWQRNAKPRRLPAN